MFDRRRPRLGPRQTSPPPTHTEQNRRRGNGGASAERDARQPGIRRQQDLNRSSPQSTAALSLSDLLQGKPDREEPAALSKVARERCYRAQSRLAAQRFPPTPRGRGRGRGTALSQRHDIFQPKPSACAKIHAQPDREAVEAVCVHGGPSPDSNMRVTPRAAAHSLPLSLPLNPPRSEKGERVRLAAPDERDA